MSPIEVFTEWENNPNFASLAEHEKARVKRNFLNTYNTYLASQLGKNDVKFPVYEGGELSTFGLMPEQTEGLYKDILGKEEKLTNNAIEMTGKENLNRRLSEEKAIGSYSDILKRYEDLANSRRIATEVPGIGKVDVDIYGKEIPKYLKDIQDLKTVPYNGYDISPIDAAKFKMNEGQFDLSKRAEMEKAQQEHKFQVERDASRYSQEKELRDKVSDTQLKADILSPTRRYIEVTDENLDEVRQSLKKVAVGDKVMALYGYDGDRGGNLRIVNAVKATPSEIATNESKVDLQNQLLSSKADSIAKKTSKDTNITSPTQAAATRTRMMDSTLALIGDDTYLPTEKEGLVLHNRLMSEAKAYNNYKDAISSVEENLKDPMYNVFIYPSKSRNFFGRLKSPVWDVVQLGIDDNEALFTPERINGLIDKYMKKNPKVTEQSEALTIIIDELVKKGYARRITEDE